MIDLAWILVTLSAILQATWNVIFKKSVDLDTFSGFFVVSIVISFSILVFNHKIAHESVVYLIFGTAFHVVARFSNFYLMKNASLSALYPLVRGLSPLFVISISMSLFVIENTYIIPAVFGVAIGCLISAYSMVREELSFKSLLLTVMVAVTSAIYVVLDSRGIVISENKFAYMAWVLLCDAAISLVITSVIRHGNREPYLRLNWTGLFGGVVQVIGYCIFLYAISISSVVIAAAVREVSIVFVVILSAFFLNEKVSLIRWLGAIIILGSLIVLKSIT